MPPSHFFIRKGQICSEPKREVEVPTIPESPSEAQIMRLKAANKPIPRELLIKSSRRRQQTSSSEESDSD